MSDIINQIFTNTIFQQLNQSELTSKYTTIENVEFESSIIQTTLIINEIPPEGIIITTPGTYTLASNINWKPITDATAITILISGVILDMKYYTIKNLHQCNNNKTIGISIKNVSDVNVINGKVENMNYYGIQVVASNNVYLTNIRVNKIKYNNLNTRFLTPCGIFANQCFKFYIQNCQVDNMNITTDSSAGIQLINCYSCEVDSCHVKNIINNDGAIQGFSIILCSGITTKNCSSDKLQSFFNGNILTSGHTVLGFCPIFCINSTYFNCKAENQIGCCDDCHGISIFLDINITIQNFTVKNIIDGVSKSNSGAKSTGIEVYGINCSVCDSYVENIKAIRPQDRQAAGFSCSGSGNTFINCTAKKVKVVDENNKTNKKIGLGVGFGWAPDPRIYFRNLYAITTTYTNCKATDCQVGFDTFNHINSVWNNIDAYKSKKCILIKPNSARFLSCNPCSECNPPTNCIVVNAFSNNTFDNIKCEKHCSTCE